MLLLIFRLFVQNTSIYRYSLVLMLSQQESSKVASNRGIL